MITTDKHFYDPAGQGACSGDMPNQTIRRELSDMNNSDSKSVSVTSINLFSDVVKCLVQ